MPFSSYALTVLDDLLKWLRGAAACCYFSQVGPVFAGSSFDRGGELKLSEICQVTQNYLARRDLLLRGRFWVGVLTLILGVLGRLLPLPCNPQMQI